MADVDDVFVRQVNGKQERAYHELFRRFYNYLVVYAMRRVQRQDVAEDVVQEVFVSMWEGDKEFNSFVGLKAFLYNAVSNRCLDYLKHQKVVEQYVAVALREGKEWEGMDLVEEEMYRELHLAVQGLPERSRAVFELHLEGKKNEEIARLLELSVLTVKSYKKNAMHYLKKRLGDLYFLLNAVKII